MKRYCYRLRLPDGKTRWGTLSALDESRARQRLCAQEGVLLSLRAIPSLQITVNSCATTHRIIKQLALMLGAALPLKESLQRVIQQHTHPHSLAMLESVYQQVCQGVPLSGAMRQHPRWFDALCCAIVEAGEWSGALPTALAGYAEHLDEQRQLRRSLRQALSYPLFLLMVSVIVIAVLLTVAVPKIVAQLSVSGVALPWSTRLILWLGESLSQSGPFIFILILIAGITTVRLLRHESIRLRWHAVLLRIPLTGRALERVQQVRLLMTLSLLSVTSVPMADALRLSAGALNNLFYRHKVLRATRWVIQGAGVCQALERESLLTANGLALLFAGEQGGRLSEVLCWLSRIERESFQQQLLGLVKLVEPALIFFLGLVVMLVFMAIIQPMLSINSLSF